MQIELITINAALIKLEKYSSRIKWVVTTTILTHRGQTNYGIVVCEALLKNVVWYHFGTRSIMRSFPKIYLPRTDAFFYTHLIATKFRHKNP